MVCHTCIHQARCDQQDAQGQKGPNTLGKPPEDGKGDAKTKKDQASEKEKKKNSKNKKKRTLSLSAFHTQ